MAVTLLFVIYLLNIPSSSTLIDNAEEDEINHGGVVIDSQQKLFSKTTTLDEAMSDYYGDCIVFDLLRYLSKEHSSAFGNYLFLNFDSWMMNKRVSLKASGDADRPLTYSRPLIDNVVKYIKGFQPVIPHDANVKFRSENQHQLAVIALIDMMLFNDDRSKFNHVIGNQAGNGADNMMLYKHDSQSEDFEYLPIDNGFGFIWILNARRKKRGDKYDLERKIKAYHQVIKFAKQKPKEFAKQYRAKNVWLYNEMGASKRVLDVVIASTIAHYGDTIVKFIRWKVNEIEPDVMIDDIIKSKCAEEYSSFFQILERNKCVTEMKKEYEEKYGEYIQSVKTMREKILENTQIFLQTKTVSAKVTIDNQFVNEYDEDMHEYEEMLRMLRLQRLIRETEQLIHRHRG